MSLELKLVTYAKWPDGWNQIWTGAASVGTVPAGGVRAPVPALMDNPVMLLDCWLTTYRMFPAGPRAMKRGPLAVGTGEPPMVSLPVFASMENTETSLEVAIPK